MATAGVAGSDAKGDCLISVEPAGSLQISVVTKAEMLVASGIESVVRDVLARYELPDVSVHLQDFGSLDYVLSARMETALRKALDLGAAPLRASVERVATSADRPRRSRLYAPGNNPRLLAGIDVHGADCVLLDLEDSVPLSEKLAARILVKHVLAAVAFPQDVWVRINALDCDGDADVREVLHGHPHGLCLPKTESAADVAALSTLLDDVEAAYGIEPGFTKIMPIIETARGVLRCEDIATADPRIVMVAFGAEDFTRDVGAIRSSSSLSFARSMIVAAATVARIQASDTVYSNLEDEEGLIKEAALARELGFDGKGALNPRQLGPIHRAFSPSEVELAYAQRVVASAQEAERSGSGAIALDGKMIDKPVLERAKRMLKYAQQLVQGGM